MQRIYRRSDRETADGAHSRMKALFHLLTGREGRVSYDYPPRHLWGDLGRKNDRVSLPRAYLPTHLQWR